MVRVTKSNSRRERALAAIRAEIAREGAETRNTVRLYVENPISFAAYCEAVREGLAWFRRDSKNKSSV